MTAVEWLVNEIQSFGIDTKFINNGIEQAKEMHKQEIIDACDSNFTYGNNDYPTLGEQYYTSTYGSKGSDVTKEESLVEKMIPHQLKYNLDMMEKLSSTSSQTEISDEEIENVAWEVYVTDTARFSFLAGAKWYREQLKQRQ
jgi:hypothetical protein